MEKTVAKKQKKSVETGLVAASENKRGAPTKYTEALADEICDRIVNGQSLNKMCPEIGISIRSVWHWLEDYPDFLRKYARARSIQADVLADEILDISREKQVEVKYQGEDITLDLSATIVQDKKVRIDANKWYASKLAPKKYGERLDTTLSGPDGGPVQVAAVNLRGLSDDDLATMQQILSRAGTG